jgi:hypothetical protein
MSILAGILEAVAAVASIYFTGGSTLGLIAGGLAAVGAAAQFGVIGGSVGQFAKSPVFSGIVAAVSLGSAAYNMVGEGAAGAETGQAAASSAAASSASSSAAASTGGAISNDVGMGMNDLTGLQSSNEMAQMTGLNPQDAAAAVNTANTAADSAAAANGASGAGGAAGTASATSTTSVANASQVVAQQTQTDLNAVGAAGANPISTTPNAGMLSSGPAQPGSLAPGAPSAPAGMVEGSNIPPPSTTPSAAPIYGAPTNYPSAVPGSPTGALSQPGTLADNPNTGLPQGVAPAQPLSDAAITSTAGAAPSAGGGGGILSNAANWMEANPKTAAAGLQVGGSLVSGAMNSMSQQKQIEEMIQAENWGNLQWQNQSQVDQLQAAAAKPITVPTGYLQRAAAVKNLVNGGGSSPQPAPGGTPIMPIAPPPTPPGMSAPTLAAPAGGMV